MDKFLILPCGDNLGLITNPQFREGQLSRPRTLIACFSVFKSSLPFASPKVFRLAKSLAVFFDGNTSSLGWIHQAFTSAHNPIFQNTEGQWEMTQHRQRVMEYSRPDGTEKSAEQCFKTDQGKKRGLLIQGRSILSFSGR